MRNYLILGLITMLIFTGCKDKNIICEKEEENNMGKALITVTAKVTNGKINEATSTIEYKDENIANQMCNLLNQSNTYSEDNNVNFECNGKIITFKDYFSLQDEIKKGLSKSDFKLKMEEQEYTCK